MAEADPVPDADLVDALRAVVGDRHVLVDPDLRSAYETDWTGQYGSPSPAVVRPGTVDEVAGVLRACAAHGVAVVPQGGNTGLVGASVPRAGEVVLSLRRFDRIEEVDLASSQVTVGAGVTLGRLQAHAAAAGLTVGLDFAARDSATMGGIVATNAGGERVLRYGMTRDQVTGLEVVLPDGSVVSRLAGLVKDNGGFDVRALLPGSEGTLGIVTGIRIRLFPPVAHRCTALLALDDLAAAVVAVGLLRNRLPSLEAVEMFRSNGLELVCDELHLPRPGVAEAPVYLLIETGTAEPIEDEVTAVLGAVAGLRDAHLAPSEAARARLWEYREGHTLALAARGRPLKLDIAVPLAALVDFDRTLHEVLATEVAGVEAVTFGHLAEGNLHLNLLGVPDERRRELTDLVLRHVGAHGGSISAEHGVGVAKTSWLPLSRSDDELAAMRAVKAALDPADTLNPGVLFSPAQVREPRSRRASRRDE